MNPQGNHNPQHPPAGGPPPTGPWDQGVDLTVSSPDQAPLQPLARAPTWRERCLAQGLIAGDEHLQPLFGGTPLLDDDGAIVTRVLYLRIQREGPTVQRLRHRVSQMAVFMQDRNYCMTAIDEALTELQDLVQPFERARQRILEAKAHNVGIHELEGLQHELDQREAPLLQTQQRIDALRAELAMMQGMVAQAQERLLAMFRGERQPNESLLYDGPPPPLPVQPVPAWEAAVLRLWGVLTTEPEGTIARHLHETLRMAIFVGGPLVVTTALTDQILQLMTDPPVDPVTGEAQMSSHTLGYSAALSVFLLVLLILYIARDPWRRDAEDGGDLAGWLTE